MERVCCDAAIEQKIGEIVTADERFHGAGVVVAVGNGVVSIPGSVSGPGDPVFLKHKVVEIEGVVDIEISPHFLPGQAGPRVGLA